VTRRGPGEGSIYERADGRWTAVVHLGYARGRRQRKHVYGKTRAEVASKLRALQTSVDQGLAPPPDRLTFDQFLTTWLTESVRPSVRPSTFRSYEGIVRVHVRPAIGRVPLNRLTPGDVQRLLNERLASGLSPRSVAMIRAVLRTALGLAVRWGQVPRNVAALTDPPRERRREMKVLDTRQARALLDQVHGDRLEALYAVALAVGLRQGEALGLRWSDIDLDGPTLAISRALQRLDGTLRFVEPKSAGSHRTLLLPAFAVSTLKRHRVGQNEERLTAGPLWEDGDLVFSTMLGRPLDARNVVRQFKRHLNGAELPDIRFHDLRHSCATLLLAQGVSPRAVMETLGHSQISLTLGTYSHVTAAIRVEVAETMERALGASFAV
jgi:integrase